MQANEGNSVLKLLACSSWFLFSFELLGIISLVYKSVGCGKLFAIFKSPRFANF